jgi:hypothetical protein
MEPHCNRPNRFKRLVTALRLRRRRTIPSEWLDEPPADPDIGVREPRRPRPDEGSGTALLDPPA